MKGTKCYYETISCFFKDFEYFLLLVGSVHVALVGGMVQACSVVACDCEAASVSCMQSLGIRPKTLM